MLGGGGSYSRDGKKKPSVSPPKRLIETLGATQVEVMRTVRNMILPMSPEWDAAFSRAVEQGLATRLLELVIPTTVFQDGSSGHDTFQRSETPFLYASWARNDGLMIMEEMGMMAMHYQRLLTIFSFLPFAALILDVVSRPTWTEFERANTQLMQTVGAMMKNASKPATMEHALEQGWWPFIEEAIMDPHRSGVATISDATPVHMIRCRLVEPRGHSADEQFRKLLYAARIYFDRRRQLEQLFAAKSAKSGRGGKKKGDDDGDDVATNDPVLAGWLQRDDAPPHHYHFDRLMVAISGVSCSHPANKAGVIIESSLYYKRACVIAAPPDDFIERVWKCKYAQGSVMFADNAAPSYTTMFDNMDMDYDHAYIPEPSDNVVQVAAMHDGGDLDAPFMDMDDDIIPVGTYPAASQQVLYKLQEWMDEPVDTWATQDVIQAGQTLLSFYAMNDPHIPPPASSVKARVLTSMYFVFAAAPGQFAACSTTLSHFDPMPLLGAGDVFRLVTDAERATLDPEAQKQLVLTRRRALEACDPVRALPLLYALECTARINDLQPRTLGADAILFVPRKETYTTYVARLVRIACLLRHQVLLLGMTDAHRQSFHVPTYCAEAALALLPHHATQTFVLMPMACAPWNFGEMPRVDFLYSAKDLYLMTSHAKLPRTLASLWPQTSVDLVQFRNDFVEPFFQAIVAMSVNLLGTLVAEVDPAKAESMPRFPDMEAAPPPQFDTDHVGTIKYNLATPFRSVTDQQQLVTVVSILSKSREYGRLEHATRYSRTCEMDVVVSPSRMEALREASPQFQQSLHSRAAEAQFGNAKVTEGVQNFFIRNNELMMLRFYHDRLIELTKTMSASAQRTDHPESRRLVASMRKMLDATMRDNFCRVILSRWLNAKLPEAFRATLRYYSELPDSDFGKHACFNALECGNLSLGAQSITYYCMFMTEIARLHSTLPLSLHLRLGHNASGRFQQSTTTQRSSVMIFGPPSTGKSNAMKKVADVAVPNTTLDLARFTTHAFSTNDTVLDGYTIQLEEVGQDMLGGKQGDNAKITAFKQRIESALVVTYAYDTSDKARSAGTRSAELVYCSVQCTNILASNEKIENVDDAILSRFIVIIVGEIDESTQVKGFRMGDQVMQAYRDEEYERVANEAGRNTLRLENCYVRIIHAAVQARVIPDVSMDVAKGMAASMLTRATRSTSRMKMRMARLLGHIINILYTLTVTRAASMCMTEGMVDPWKYHHPQSRRREYTHEMREDFSYARQRPATRPHSLDILLTLAPRFMYTTKQDLIMALTMIRDDIDQRLNKQLYQFFISQLVRGEGLKQVEVYRTFQMQHGVQTTGAASKTAVARYNYNYLIVRPPDGNRTAADMIQWVADTMSVGGSRLGVQQISHIIRDMQSSNVTVQPWQDLNLYKCVPPWDSPLPTAPSQASEEAEEAAVAQSVQRDHAQLIEEDQHRNRQLVEKIATGAPPSAAAAMSGTGGGTAAAPAKPGASRGGIFDDPLGVNIPPIQTEENMSALLVREEEGRPYFAVLDTVLRSVYQASSRSLSASSQGFLGAAPARKLDDPTQWASFLDNAHTDDSELVRAICHVLEKETLERYPDHVYAYVIRTYTYASFKAAYGILLQRYGGGDLAAWDVPHLKAFIDKCPFEYLTAINQSEDAMRDCFVHFRYGESPETNTSIPTVYRFLRTLRLKRKENVASVMVNNTLPLRPAAETLSGPYGSGSAAVRDAKSDRVKQLQWDMDYLSYLQRCDAMALDETDEDMIYTIPWISKLHAVHASLKTGLCIPERGMRAYPDHLIEVQLKDHMSTQRAKQMSKKKSDRRTPHPLSSSSSSSVVPDATDRLMAPPDARRSAPQSPEGVPFYASDQGPRFF